MYLILEMAMEEFYLAQTHKLGMTLELVTHNLGLLLAIGGLDMFITKEEILVLGNLKR